MTEKNAIIHVLVVDDSAFMRKAIREMLEQSERIEVVGTAWSGEDALEKLDALRPDVVTIDLLMPGMDGVHLIRQIMERHPLPVVVCSSLSLSGEIVVAAMEAGAVEFIPKPTALALDKMYKIQRDLVKAVTTAASISIERLVTAPIAPRETVGPPIDLSQRGVHSGRLVDIVVIGISTGGPRGLRTILPRFPANFPVPIVVALHMSPGYTNALAQSLNEISQVEVVESADNLELLPGRVTLAQAGMNTTLTRRTDGRVVTMLQNDVDDYLYIPSVNALFRSAVELFESRVVGVVMTGMGDDGSEGAAWIKSAGGFVIAESEQTSVIFGMPRAVIEAGLADRVVGMDQIPEAIMEVVL